MMRFGSITIWQSTIMMQRAWRFEYILKYYALGKENTHIHKK